jgi:phosphoglycerol transferase MdoB-like AlkP superfamily enzyme
MRTAARRNANFEKALQRLALRPTSSFSSALRSLTSHKPFNDMMSYGGGKSGLGDALGDVLQNVRAKDEEIVRFKVELERQSRRCQSSDQERK